MYILYILHELNSINIITEDKWLDAPELITELATNVKEYNDLNTVTEAAKDLQSIKYLNYQIFTDID